MESGGFAGWSAQNMQHKEWGWSQPMGEGFFFSGEFFIVPQQQNALGSSAIVKVSEQTEAAPKPIPPRFPGSKYRFPVQVPK